MTHQFFVTLPSDSSMKCYPENTVAKFTTKLPQSLTLEGEYEVGLAELIYPQTWYNINNFDAKYWIAIAEYGSLGIPLKRCVIETNNYRDAEEFIKSLNDQMSSAFKDIEHVKLQFIYHKHSGKIEYKWKTSPTIALKRTDLEFFLSPKLQLRLGITDEFTCVNSSGSYMADEAFVLNEDLNLMYVYCDVAAHTVVGDTMAPLLRVLNLNNESYEMIRLSFPDIHYKPVQKRQFDSIEISINTARGLVLPFESGRSVVTLHFRRVFNLFQK